MHRPRAGLKQCLVAEPREAETQIDVLVIPREVSVIEAPDRVPEESRLTRSEHAEQ